MGTWLVGLRVSGFGLIGMASVGICGAFGIPVKGAGCGGVGALGPDAYGIWQGGCAGFGLKLLWGASRRLPGKILTSANTITGALIYRLLILMRLNTSRNPAYTTIYGTPIKQNTRRSPGLSTLGSSGKLCRRGISEARSSANST